MNKLSKVILRSALRWSRSHDNNAPCLLKLIPERHSRILKHLPENAVISTPNKIRAAALYLARTVRVDSLEEARICNEAFDVLRILDNVSEGMAEEKNGRLFRSDPTVLEKASIRIGQVVKHMTSGYRGICFGWTMDEATDTQTLSILIDWYDYEEILHNQIPLKFNAEDFEVISDDRLLRIHHQDVSMYFSRFDVERGIYIPTADLLYQYPDDLAHLLATHNPALNSSNIVRDADIASTRISVFAEYLVATLAETLVNCGVLPDSFLDENSLEVADETGRIINSRLQERGKEVLQDVVTHLKGIRTTLTNMHSPLSAAPSPLHRPTDNIATLLKEILATDAVVVDEALLVSEQQKRLDAAHNLLSHIFSLFIAIEQLLVQRFQCVGGGSYFLALAPLAFPSRDGALVLSDQVPEGTELGDGTSSVGKAKLPIDYINPPVTFRVGQVVRHKLFNYRGVVTGWDIRPSVDTSQWDGVKDSLLGKEQPYYRVSVMPICRP